jgi:zinc transporter, ZIP family
MGFAETTLLGAIAGFTIYLGLPAGRVQSVDDRLRVALGMLSVGILAFIFVDVIANGQAIIQTALRGFKDHRSAFGHVLALFVLLAAGFTAGTAGISSIQRSLRRRVPARPPVAGGDAATVLSASELAGSQRAAHQAALRTGLTIAAAIGLHNFAEGLAIGVSAKAGAIGLATVLIVGFGVHNATEGFGIVGPLGGVRPSWRWLGIAGLIAGGPTFLGTLLGYQVHSDTLELAFYALAGGAILYVVGEIWTAMRVYGHRTLGLYLLALGFILGVATDLIISYGGG